MNETIISEFSVNESLQLSPEFDPSLLAFNIILGLIFIFSLAFNSISIVSILTAKAFTPTNLLVMNLGLADITYTLGIPFFISQIFSIDWPFGEIACKLFFFTEFSGIIVGMFTVAALSIERFLDVSDKKNRLESISNRLKTIIIIFYSIFIWTIAILFSLPFIMSIKLVKHNELRICQSEWDDSKFRFFFITKFIIVFLIPYSIILISSFKLLIFLNDWKRRYNRAAITQRKVHLIELKNEKDNISAKKRLKIIKLNRKQKLKHTKSLNESNQQTILITKHNVTSSFLNSTNTNISRSFSINNYDYLQIKAQNKESSINSIKDIDTCFESDTNSNYPQNKSNSNRETDSSYSSISKLFDSLKNNWFMKRQKKQQIIKNRYLDNIRRKAVRLVLVIILLFIIQWSPFWIFQIFLLFSTSNVKYIQLINMVVSTLTYSNTVANPTLYMLLTYNFKEYIQKTKCYRLFFRPKSFIF